MLWILISLFFCWLIFREFQSRSVARAGYDTPDSTPISIPYLAFLVALALLFAWPPFHYWRIERFLSAKATELAEPHQAKVHCNTIFDTFVDREYLASGHADPKTGEIALQYPWCERLMDYLDHPERANWEEISSLNMLTHESMHVRGEYNEAITECEAVQRDYRAAKLLGVPDGVARKNALDYYQNIYLTKGKTGGIQSAYFSAECAPDKALDEHLVDSTWATHTAP
jgi:hypothetical protein